MCCENGSAVHFRKYIMFSTRLHGEVFLGSGLTFTDPFSKSCFVTCLINAAGSGRGFPPAGHTHAGMAMNSARYKIIIHFLKTSFLLIRFH